jgi:hypothetical protein
MKVSSDQQTEIDELLAADVECLEHPLQVDQFRSDWPECPLSGQELPPGDCQKADQAWCAEQQRIVVLGGRGPDVAAPCDVRRLRLGL